MKKRIRTREEQSFVEGCEVAFDYGLGDELSSEELERYEYLINETEPKCYRYRIAENETLTKEQAVAYLEKVLKTWSYWKTHHKLLSMAIETLLKELKNEKY